METEFVRVTAFMVGNQICGFEHRPHEQVLHRPKLQPLQTPFPWLRHQMELPHGHAIPVLDLKQLVEIKVFGNGEPQNEGSVAVSRINDQEVGLWVYCPYFNRIPKQQPDRWYIPTEWYPLVSWVGEMGDREVYILDLEQLVQIHQTPSDLNRWND